MNPIIDPRWFYWLSVLNGLKIFCAAFGICGVVGAIFAIIVFSCEHESVPTWSKVWLGCSILFIIIAIFIPNQETMYRMMLAKYATYDNVDRVIETITDTAVKIIESVNN